MKVTLATHGGLAAGLRLGSAPREVDTSTLGEPEVAELNRLVAAVRQAPPPAARSGGPGAMSADAMTYVVTVEDERPVVLRQSDVAMTAEFAGLLRWLQDRMPPERS